MIRFTGPPGRGWRLVALLALALGAVATTVTATLVSGRSADRGSSQGEQRATATATVESRLPVAGGTKFSGGPHPAEAITSAAATGWPRPGDGVTGLPAGWQPKRVVHGSLVVRTAGATVEDVEVKGGDIEVHAPNVTVRRVRVSGGGIGNWWDHGCGGTLTIDRAEILGAGVTTTIKGGPVIGPGSYVAQHVLIDGVVEGFRVSDGTAESGNRCGPAVIRDSFVRLAEPAECRGGGPYPDWHGDGLQGYKGAGVTVTRTTIQMFGNAAKAPCDGTSPFLWGDENGPARIDRLLVIGGAYYAFRLASAGEVRGLVVATGYGGVEVAHCNLLTAWDAHYAAVDLRTYAVGPIGKAIPCDSAA